VWYNAAALKRILQIAAVIVLAIVLLVLFLRNSDPGDVMAVIASTNPAWLALGFAANFCALLCRTQRWRTILDPANPPRFYDTFFSNSVGYMLSTVLPIRAGDIARPALLSRRTGIKFSTALGTVLTEKVFDLFAILSLFVFFVITAGPRFTSNPATARKFVVVQSAAVTAAMVVIVLAGFLISLVFFQDRIRKIHGFIGRVLPRRFRDGWMRFFDSFVRSMALARHGGALPRVILLTACIWMCLSSQFFFVLLAIRHPLHFTASFFISGMTILGLMIPTPGGVGGFHKACQIALTHFYGFTVSSSVAAALLVHIVGVTPVVITGIILVVKTGLSFKQLSHIGEEVDQELAKE
jgi:uncharacterized protein (TIRG00374 family)